VGLKEDHPDRRKGHQIQAYDFEMNAMQQNTISDDYSQDTLKYAFNGSKKQPGVVYFPEENIAVTPLADVDLASARASGVVKMPDGEYRNVEWLVEMMVKEGHGAPGQPPLGQPLVFTGRHAFEKWKRHHGLDMVLYDGGADR
jgi:hypothetical protein